MKIPSILVLVVINTLLVSHSINAQTIQTATTLASVVKNSPDQAALSIIKNSVDSILTLNNKDRKDFAQISTLLNSVLIQHIDITSATEFALRKHWSEFNQTQKSIFEAYILKSIINDYSNILLVSNSELSNVKFTLDPEIKRKGNKAIVTLMARFQADTPAIPFSLRMIKGESWKIYDLIFSGVSLMKSYRAKIGNQIKRRGLNATLARLSK